MQPIPEARTEDGERPDLRLNLDSTRLLLDLSVTHPTMPSALSTGRSSRPLGAARQREYEKKHKYTELATMERATVIPLVLDTTGASARVSVNLSVVLPPKFMTESSLRPPHWLSSDFSPVRWRFVCNVVMLPCSARAPLHSQTTTASHSNSVTFNRAISPAVQTLLSTRATFFHHNS